MNGREVLLEDLPKITALDVLCTNMVEIEVGSIPNVTFDSQETISLEEPQQENTSTVLIELQNVTSDVLIYQGVVKSFFFPISQLSSAIQEKLLNQTPLLRTEFNSVLREFAKQIFQVEPAITAQKLNLLAEQLCVKFQGLIERDEVGEVRNNGFDSVALSLELKIGHLRRKSLLGPTVNLKQAPKSKVVVDNVFKSDIDLIKNLKANYTPLADKIQIQEVLTKTFAYQRATIQFSQKGGAGDSKTLQKIIEDWPFFLVSCLNDSFISFN